MFQTLKSLVVFFVVGIPIATRAVPSTEDLPKPLENAVRYAIVSPAGKHGTSFIWKNSDGTISLRESLLLRGQIWEQYQSVRLNSAGIPVETQITGFAPSGDAAESLRMLDGRAQWTSPIDSGEAKFDDRSFYIPFGGTWTFNGLLCEALLKSSTKSLSLLPGGMARIIKMGAHTVGSGSNRLPLTLYVVEGLDLSPTPVWMHGNKFFGLVSGMGLLPEAHQGELRTLQRAQDEALQQRGPMMMKKFGKVAQTPVVFLGVRVFEAENASFSNDQTVVFDKGIITAVGRSIDVVTPKGARVIDGRGKTLVPGLWDAHMHVRDDAQGVMLLSLGITSARDPGAAVETTVVRNARISAGKLLFPQVYSSVLIDGKGPLQAQIGKAVSSVDETLAAVRMAKDKGFTGVKFYTSMQPQWLLPGIAEAKKLGLHVHGHVPATMRPHDAIAAGYDEITHIYFVMMQAMPDDVVNQSNGMQRFEGPGRYARNVDLGAEPLKSLVAEMASKKIIVDPTLVVVESKYASQNGDLSPAYAPFLGTLPPVAERGFRAGGFAVPLGMTRDDYRASFRKQAELVAALYKAGVPIVAGTDGSGMELVRELELYVMAGLTPGQALQTATIVPASIVGADKNTGSIAVGKSADMVLVDGDPSKNIGVLRQTLWVVSKGRLMNADALREAAGFSGKPK